MTNKKDSYKKLHLVKVPAAQLELGMHVAKLDRPWLETPFLFQGFPIHKQEDLDTLRNICEYVYVDVLKTHDLSHDLRTNMIAPGTPTTRYENTTSVEDEIRSASVAYQKNLEEIKDCFSRSAVAPTTSRPNWSSSTSRSVWIPSSAIRRP
ncbi:MAG: DUF3391 domain-containing protein [Gammaproteobacteria bacterium]